MNLMAKRPPGPWRPNPTVPERRGGGWHKRLWHRLTCSGYIGTKWCRDPAHNEGGGVMENDLHAGIEWVSINQYIGVRDRYYWLDSLLARLHQNPEPANVAAVLTEWRRGFQGAHIDGSGAPDDHGEDDQE